MNETVKVTHTQPRYARTRNGAWLGNGAETTVRTLTFEEAARLHTGSGYYTLKYADGTIESLDADSTPCGFFSTDPKAERKTSRALGKIGYYAWSRE